MYSYLERGTYIISQNLIKIQKQKQTTGKIIKSKVKPIKNSKYKYEIPKYIKNGIC